MATEAARLTTVRAKARYAASARPMVAGAFAAVALGLLSSSADWLPAWVVLLDLGLAGAWAALMLLVSPIRQAGPGRLYFVWVSPSVLVGILLIKHAFWPDGYEFYSAALFLATQAVAQVVIWSNRAFTEA